MNATFRRLACLSLLALAACAGGSPNVQTTTDPKADLSKYTTYAFANSDPKEPGTITDPIIRQRLAGMIAAQLSARGYQMAAQGQAPALAVHFTGSISQQQRVFMEGPGQGYYGYGWRQDMGGFDTSNYRKGSLTVDLVDPRLKQRVWQARVSEALTESYSEENWKRIESALATAFKDLPAAR
ncbi:MAG: DUF4136 domain-containing protein [Burkholderiales bacterium]